MVGGRGLLKRPVEWCRSSWCSLAIKLLGFALFLFVDPFGLASETSRTSQELVYRLTSLYSNDDVSRPVSLVLIDDRSAPEFNRERGYPLTFSQHAAILRPVLCAAPATLFIDITFRGVRSNAPAPEGGAIDPELGELMRVLSGTDPEEQERCRLMGLASGNAHAPTKVMIGRVRSVPPSACDPLYGHQLADDCVVGRALDHLAGVAEPISLSPVARDGAYPIVTFGEDAGRAEPQASAALAMLLAFCDRATPEQQAKFAGCRERSELSALVDLNVSRTRVQMYPKWSYFFSPELLADRARGVENAARDDRASVRCPQPQHDFASGPLGRLATAAEELWHSLIQGAREADVADGRDFGEGACVATDTFTALDVRNMSSQCGEDGTLCSQRLSTFFGGRIVVYGIDIVGINDKVESPVLGWVPGAAFHAAAAETLLSEGSGYAHAARTVTLAGLAIESSIVYEIVLAGLILVLIRGLPRMRGGSIVIGPIVALALVVLFSSLVAAASNGLSVAKVIVGAFMLAGAAALIYLHLAAENGRAVRGLFARAGGGLTNLAIAFVFVPLLVTAVLMVFAVPPANVAALLLIATIAADEDS